MSLTPERLSEFKRVIGSTVEGVPPTLLTVFREAEFEIMRTMAFELKQVLHAEQEYELTDDFYDRYDPLKPIEFQSRLAVVNEKRGRGMRLVFMVFETDYFFESDKPIGLSRTTIVLRIAEGTTA